MNTTAYFLLLLLLFNQDPVTKYQNYVEIELKFRQPNHVQLFVVSNDSLPSFTEKQSYWHKVTTVNKFQIVRWKLRDVEYKRFRIDIATKPNQHVEIKSVTIHVNNNNKKFVGNEILNFFKPNVFLRLESCQPGSLAFKTIDIEGFTDPWLYPLYDSISFNTNANALVKINLSCQEVGVMAISILDEKGKRYGFSQCVKPGKNSVSFNFNSSSFPRQLSIQPSIGNENEIVINNILLGYKQDTIIWAGDKIGSRFSANGDYYQLDNDSPEFFVKTKIHRKFGTFELWKMDLEFPSEIVKKMLLALLVSIISCTLLFYINRYTLTYKSKFIEEL